MRPFDADEAYVRMRVVEPTMASTDPLFWNVVVFALGFLFGMAAVGLPALFVALAT